MALLILLVIGTGFVGYRFRQAVRAAERSRKIPDELKSARIELGADRFSKESLFAKSDLGLITDFKANTNHDLVVVGQSGAAILQNGRSLSRSVSFKKCSSAVVWVEVANGSFLCRGAWGGNAELFDAQGKTVWSYGGIMPGIDDATAGTLGANQTPAVVVGFNGDGGIRRLNAEGKELWKQDDGNVWHVEIVSKKNAGNVIVHSNSRGEVVVRDADGKVLRRHAPDIYLAFFGLTAWTDDLDLDNLVTSDKGTIYILDIDGKTVARLPAPGSASLADTKSTQVHLSPGAPYFAALLHYLVWNRSLLYVYDNQNKLIYHEVLDHGCGALHATPAKNDLEDLLVGCEGTVLKYSLTESK